MSKVLFFCIPAHGHVNPTLALIAELVKNDDRVICFDYIRRSEKDVC